MQNMFIKYVHYISVFIFIMDLISLLNSSVIRITTTIQLIGRIRTITNSGHLIGRFENYCNLCRKIVI